jgi:osmoprotectant transport system ATP-binding protein
MIRLENVSKTFRGAPRPAVERLDLDVPGGTTCVLIGPSGCGKTTTMRIVNRLIEPDQGRIVVEGQDVTRSDAVELRRRIGYVIQQVGLFPHMTIAQNVATVPQLLGWPAERIARRVDEMLSLVGLEPAQFLHRHPRHLSGGQRQRVGVARALAADPPVMLMDEPFAAVDPIVRAGLQAELLGILRRLAKTVIFVTHDIDEAIRMGDLIAVMKDGKVVQCAAPAELLAAPKDSFVADFVGTDRALKRLTLTTAGEAARSGREKPVAAAPTVAASASLRDTLSVLLQNGATVANVVDAGGTPIGAVSLSAIRERAATPPSPSQEPQVSKP